MKRPAIGQLKLALAEGGESPTPTSRATARRGRGRGGALGVPMPWSCAVLAVDTARVSGWASFVRGRFVACGSVNTLDEATIDQIVGNAVDRAACESVAGGAHAMPLVLVLEAPFGGAVEVVAALGVARERWLRAWRAVGESPKRVVKVSPSTWRAAVLGGSWSSACREEVRAHEMRIARAWLVRERGRAPLLDHDEAAAVLIGRWASHAHAVGRVIGKRAFEASLAGMGFRKGPKR